MHHIAVFRAFAPFGLEKPLGCMRAECAQNQRIGLEGAQCLLQAARQLGVSVDTVRRWQDGGKLQGYRTPGGQRRIYQADIDRVLAGSPGTTEEAVS